jgi:hypothetical protein
VGQRSLRMNYLCIFALAAWRSGHRIRLSNISPGFESRQGVRFLGKVATLLCIIDLLRIVGLGTYVFVYFRKKALVTKIL